MKGFTLIEVMMVVIIVAVLGSISLPSYREYVVDTRRGVAKACLIELTHVMERYYSNNLTYVDATLPDTSCTQEVGDYYDFSLASTPTANTFSISALALGTQAENDAECELMVVDHLNDMSPAECW